jgi:hypothetical protein
MNVFAVVVTLLSATSVHAALMDASTIMSGNNAAIEVRPESLPALDGSDTPNITITHLINSSFSLCPTAGQWALSADGSNRGVALYSLLFQGSSIAVDFHNCSITLCRGRVSRIGFSIKSGGLSACNISITDMIFVGADEANAELQLAPVDQHPTPLDYVRGVQGLSVVNLWHGSTIKVANCEFQRFAPLSMRLDTAAPGTFWTPGYVDAIGRQLLRPPNNETLNVEIFNNSFDMTVPRSLAWPRSLGCFSTVRLGVSLVKWTLDGDTFLMRPGTVLVSSNRLTSRSQTGPTRCAELAGGTAGGCALCALEIYAGGARAVVISNNTASTEVADTVSAETVTLSFGDSDRSQSDTDLSFSGNTIVTTSLTLLGGPTQHGLYLEALDFDSIHVDNNRFNVTGGPSSFLAGVRMERTSNTTKCKPFRGVELRSNTLSITGGFRSYAFLANGIDPSIAHASGSSILFESNQVRLERTIPSSSADPGCVGLAVFFDDGRVSVSKLSFVSNNVTIPRCDLDPTKDHLLFSLHGGVGVSVAGPPWSGVALNVSSNTVIISGHRGMAVLDRLGSQRSYFTNNTISINTQLMAVGFHGVLEPSRADTIPAVLLDGVFHVSHNTVNLRTFNVSATSTGAPALNCALNFLCSTEVHALKSAVTDNVVTITDETPFESSSTSTGTNNGVLGLAIVASSNLVWPAGVSASVDIDDNSLSVASAGFTSWPGWCVIAFAAVDIQRMGRVVFRRNFANVSVVVSQNTKNFTRRPGLQAGAFDVFGPYSATQLVEFLESTAIVAAHAEEAFVLRFRPEFHRTTSVEQAVRFTANQATLRLLPGPPSEAVKGISTVSAAAVLTEYNQSIGIKTLDIASNRIGVTIEGETVGTVHGLYFNSNANTSLSLLANTVKIIAPNVTLCTAIGGISYASSLAGAASEWASYMRANGNNVTVVCPQCANVTGVYVNQLTRVAIVSIRNNQVQLVRNSTGLCGISSGIGIHLQGVQSALSVDVAGNTVDVTTAYSALYNSRIASGKNLTAFLIGALENVTGVTLSSNSVVASFNATEGIAHIGLWSRGASGVLNFAARNNTFSVTLMRRPTADRIYITATYAVIHEAVQAATFTFSGNLVDVQTFDDPSYRCQVPPSCAQRYVSRAPPTIFEAHLAASESLRTWWVPVAVGALVRGSVPVGVRATITVRDNSIRVGPDFFVVGLALETGNAAAAAILNNVITVLAATPSIDASYFSAAGIVSRRPDAFGILLQNSVAFGNTGPNVNISAATIAVSATGQVGRAAAVAIPTLTRFANMTVLSSTLTVTCENCMSAGSVLAFDSITAKDIVFDSINFTANITNVTEGDEVATRKALYGLGIVDQTYSVFESLRVVRCVGSVAGGSTAAAIAISGIVKAVHVTNNHLRVTSILRSDTRLVSYGDHLTALASRTDYVYPGAFGLTILYPGSLRLVNVSDNSIALRSIHVLPQTLSSKPRYVLAYPSVDTTIYTVAGVALLGGLYYEADFQAQMHANEVLVSVDVQDSDTSIVVPVLPYPDFPDEWVQDALPQRDAVRLRVALCVLESLYAFADGVAVTANLSHNTFAANIRTWHRDVNSWSLDASLYNHHNRDAGAVLNRAIAERNVFRFSYGRGGQPRPDTVVHAWRYALAGLVMDRVHTGSVTGLQSFLLRENVIASNIRPVASFFSADGSAEVQRSPGLDSPYIDFRSECDKLTNTVGNPRRRWRYNDVWMGNETSNSTAAQDLQTSALSFMLPICTATETSTPSRTATATTSLTLSTSQTDDASTTASTSLSLLPPPTPTLSQTLTATRRTPSGSLSRTGSRNSTATVHHDSRTATASIVDSSVYALDPTSSRLTSADVRLVLNGRLGPATNEFRVTLRPTESPATGSPQTNSFSGLPACRVTATIARYRTLRDSLLVAARRNDVPELAQARANGTKLEVKDLVLDATRSTRTAFTIAPSDRGGARDALAAVTLPALLSSPSSWISSADFNLDATSPPAVEVTSPFEATVSFTPRVLPPTSSGAPTTSKTASAYLAQVADHVFHVVLEFDATCFSRQDGHRVVDAFVVYSPEPETEQPPPSVESNSVAVTTTAGIFTGLGGSVGGGGAAGLASRNGALTIAGSCLRDSSDNLNDRQSQARDKSVVDGTPPDASYDTLPAGDRVASEDLDYVDSPLQLQVLGSTAVGAVLGNTLIMVCLVAVRLLAAVAWYHLRLRRGSRVFAGTTGFLVVDLLVVRYPVVKPVLVAASLTRLPSIDSVVFLFLLSPTVALAVATLSAPRPSASSPADGQAHTAIAIICLLLQLIMSCLCAAAVCATPFPAIFRPNGQTTSGRDDGIQARFKSFASSLAGTGEWEDASFRRDEARMTLSQAASGHTHRWVRYSFVRTFGLLFIDYMPKYRWWIVVEIVTGWAVGIVDGLVRGGNCTAGQAWGLGIVLTLYAAATAALRPHEARHNFIITLVMGVVQALAGLAIALGMSLMNNGSSAGGDGTPQALFAIGTVALTAVTYLVFLRAVYDGARAAARTFFSRLRKQYLREALHRMSTAGNLSVSNVVEVMDALDIACLEPPEQPNTKEINSSSPILSQGGDAFLLHGGFAAQDVEDGPSKANIEPSTTPATTPAPKCHSPAALKRGTYPIDPSPSADHQRSTTSGPRHQFTQHRARQAHESRMAAMLAEIDRIEREAVDAERAVRSREILVQAARSSAVHTLQRSQARLHSRSVGFDDI